MNEIVINTEGKSVDDIIDEVEYAIYNNGDLIDAPVTHQFLPGLYLREIFMPKGCWATSLTHKAFNPYFIMTGKLSIYSENDGMQHIEAPYRGITAPLTRRALHIDEDTYFTTCHVTDVFPEDDSKQAFDKAVAQVEEQITMTRYNKLLCGYLRNNVLTPSIDENTTELVGEELDVNIYS